jgi:L-ascorbate metabolism protein UlaG (beta-lactamase superfamily)
MIEKIHWLGHASFRIDGRSAVIYIDPWKLKNPVPGDLVLVTHEHFDHCSPDDITAVLRPTTRLVCSLSARESLKGVVGPDRVLVIGPGEETSVGDVTVRAVAAYNTAPERQGFHPRDKARPRVGFVVTVDGATVYHTGDSDGVPEMDDLAPDVLLIPVGGTYTMDPRQAAEAASRIGPRMAVPMHWGDIVGGRADAEEFKKLYKGNVTILEKE